MNALVELLATEEACSGYLIRRSIAFVLRETRLEVPGSEALVRIAEPLLGTVPSL